MAMSGIAHPRQEQIQQVGSLDPVRKVRFEAGVCSKTREPSDQCGDLQSLHGSQEMLPSDMVPNETLVKAAYEKVVAEERLKTLMLDYKEQLAKLQKKVENYVHQTIAYSYFFKT